MQNVIIVLGLMLSSLAGAQNTVKNVTGADARSLIEALVGAGFHANEDFDADGGLMGITVLAEAFVCKHPHMVYPDEWLSNLECYMDDENMLRLRNPIALLKAIENVATTTGAAGTIYYNVAHAKCVYDHVKYAAAMEKGDHDQAVADAYTCAVEVVDGPTN